MFCPVVLCKSTSLRKYGGAPCLSMAEEERLVHVGPTEGGRCLALYSSRLSELVKTVWRWILFCCLMSGRRLCEISFSFRESKMRTCVCFTCPLSSSHQSDLTFSSHKEEHGDRASLIYYVATQMPLSQISSDTRSSQLKIPQGLGRVPMMDLIQKPSAELFWLRYIRLSFQEALGGVIACEWCQGGRAQIASPTSPPDTGKNRIYLPTPKVYSLVVSCVG